MINLLWQELKQKRGGILGYGLGMGLWAWAVFAIYPSMAEQFVGFELPEFYKMFGDITDLASLEGFLDVEYLIWVPILLGIYGLIAGTGALAGEEDQGTLEQLMALPIARWQLVLTKAIAIAIAMLLILLIAHIGVLIGYQSLINQIDTDVTAADLFRTTLNGLPIVLLFTIFSLWLGAFLPHRREAGVVATTVFIASYFIQAFAGISEEVERFQFLSPFYYYDGKGVLTTGWDAGNLAVLLGGSLLFLIFALISFQRRNITVGAWFWQKAVVRS